MISFLVCCPNLVSLGFHNCEFVEDTNDSDLSLAQLMRRRELRKETLNLVTQLFEVKTLKIVSSCSKFYLELILQQCLNVSEIFMGMNTALDDITIGKILEKNGLQHLKKLTIQGSKHVTMQGVETLLANCDNLNEFTDLTGFKRIQESEISALKQKIRVENLDLDIGQNGDSFEMSFMHRRVSESYGESWGCSSDVLV